MEKVFSETKYTICDKLILSLFAVFCSLNLLNMSSFMLINDFFNLFLSYSKYIIFFIMFALACFSVLKRWKFINLVWAIMMLLALTTFLFSGNKIYIVMLAVLFVMNNFKFDEILKIAWFSMLITFVIIVTFSVVGIIPDTVIARYGEFGEIKYFRYSVGFNHPTIPAMFVLFLILMRMYIIKFKVNFFEFITEFLWIVLVYGLTDSRASMFLSLAVLACALFYSLFSSKIQKLGKTLENKFIKILIIFVPIIFLILSVLLAIMYSKDFVIAHKINSYLSGRLRFASEVINNHKISLFGCKLNSGIILDNAYINMIYTLGVINSILVCVLYSIALYTQLKHKNYTLLFILLICLCLGFVESILVDYRYSVFVFALSSVIFRNDKVIKVGDKFKIYVY